MQPLTRRQTQRSLDVLGSSNSLTRGPETPPRLALFEPLLCRLCLGDGDLCLYLGRLTAVLLVELLVVKSASASARLSHYGHFLREICCTARAFLRRGACCLQKLHPPLRDAGGDLLRWVRKVAAVQRTHVSAEQMAVYRACYGTTNAMSALPSSDFKRFLTLKDRCMSRHNRIIRRHDLIGSDPGFLIPS